MNNNNNTNNNNVLRQQMTRHGELSLHTSGMVGKPLFRRLTCRFRCWKLISFLPGKFISLRAPFLSPGCCTLFFPALNSFTSLLSLYNFTVSLRCSSVAPLARNVVLKKTQNQESITTKRVPLEHNVPREGIIRTQFYYY